MTDSGWPEFMRVHPIIDWTYKDIWDFLLRLRIPYCSLYDEGFTSLGSMENTHPNPNLAQEEDQGKYKPAFMLTNDSYERCGRFGTSKDR
ncbi:Phosphoadenosine phosphosulfate reductase family-domain-containing protein [Absidia repens]|uniref:FAD synthase n=1 Tax=Absidia repens TaxID=90262 RepID=A0A1X2IXR0_9FUNG|nr:Phosphoadenosine phosphosulfate reductase family-domain-containing protein [Absidia repens]